jgi:hypothetical protein
MTLIRRWHLLAAALMALAVSYIGPLGASTAVAGTPCTDVEIVGLRGSSEEYLASQHGMGSLLGPVADTIMTQLSGAVTFSAYGVPYSAVDAISGVLDGDYFQSKHEGSEMLHEYLLERAVKCPGTKFVVMGYSQGAHAAGDELAGESSFITDRIAAFVMFGDPRFNPEAAYDWGSFDHRDRGLAGARSLSDFSGWSDRVFSFCHQNDLICQGIGWDHGTDAHSQQKYVSDYADLVAGLVRRRLGLTQLPRVPLDLAFVIDSTGSMGSSIQGVREAVSSMVDKLEEKESDYRIGLVDYKDTDQGDPYAAQVDLDLGPNAPAFRSALDAFSVSGGGDEPEAVYSGLMKAFTGLSWRATSRKAVILIGDAPGKDPEPITGYTRASVLAASHSISPVTPLVAPSAVAAGAAGGDSASIYPVAVGSAPLSTFDPLAEGSGGTVFPVAGSTEVSEELLEAVDTAAAPVEVVLSSTGERRPGETVTFSVGANYVGGEIVDYAWDFDGDGIIDETTSSRQVTHVYPGEFEGTADVTAIASDGHEGSASTPVTITVDAPVPAGPPAGLTVASPAPNTLQMTWQPPADLGGGSLAGYEVRVEDRSDSRLLDARGVSSSTNQLSLGSIPAGIYSVTVDSVTEAGSGAASEGAAAVTDPTTSQGLSPDGATSPSSSSSTVTGRAAVHCRKGLRSKKAHGKARCVKRKKHRHHHHQKRKHRKRGGSRAHS